VTRTRDGINKVQYKIGLKRQDNEDTTELVQQKRTLEVTKKAEEAIAKANHAELLALAKTIGNYVDCQHLRLLRSSAFHH
jgi:seryl-tRNA synthetase